MKKTIKFLFCWFILAFSVYASATIITDKLNSITNNTYDKTGITIKDTYNSDIDESIKQIEVYRYLQCNKLPPEIKNSSITELSDIPYGYTDMLFALIPRKLRENVEISIDISKDVIERMNNNLNYYSEAINQAISINSSTLTKLEIIKKNINFLLKPIDHFLRESNIIQVLSDETTATLKNALVGNYCLYMPNNMQQLMKFNGAGRMLFLAATKITDLLLLANNLDYSTNINQQQILTLQFLILEAVAKAKTPIFIPECTSRYISGKLCLPIALINDVTLDAEDQSITLNLLLIKNNTTDYRSFYQFTKERNNLVSNNSNNDNWIFLNYKLENASNIPSTSAETNNIDTIYNVSDIQLSENGIIKQYDLDNTNGEVEDINDGALLDEARAPDESIGEVHEKNNMRINDLFEKYDSNDENINKNISDLFILMSIKDPSIDSDIQRETLKIQEEIEEYNNKTGEDDIPNFLCEHYERKCYVKFACCEQYYPCHRCHNYHYSSDDTHNNKLKANNAIKVKCLRCNTEQDISPDSQYCQNCNLKLCEYFCSICQHFTGNKDKPYHCEKCGICRIHEDRSFHCDACGCCLDKQLKNNHKCRYSVNDVCPICLESTFSGCHILDCSHRMHKYCANDYIRSGKTFCPICRESFRHQLIQKNNN